MTAFVICVGSSLLSKTTDVTIAYHYLDSFRPAQKNEPCSEGFV